MDIPLAVVFTLLGLAVGSFLNVVIDRLPAGKSLVSPPSHCDACGRKLGALENVPVFSYLVLGGRCRSCRARIPRRVLLVELLGGALFLLAFWRFGLSPAFGFAAFWSCVFVAIIFIDWEHQLILNKITYPAMLLALVVLAVQSLLPDVGLLDNLVFNLGPPILSGIIGAAIGGAFFLIIFIINPSGMGMGDVKLAVLIGLVTGFPMCLLALLIGIVLGGVVAVVLLSTGVKKRKDVMPYGSFLAIGPIVILLWGINILGWYAGQF